MKPKLIRKSVNASVKDGVFWSMMTGFVDPYAVPFALNLGASNFVIGVLRSFPSLITSVFQIFNEKIVASIGSCKKAVMINVLMQAFSAGIAACAIFLPPGWNLAFFAFMMVLYTLGGSLAGPPWAALMGEYIPRSKRGAFFGFRNQVIGVTFFAASLAAAGILSLKWKNSLTGFAVIFVLAFFWRLISAYYVGQMHEPCRMSHMPVIGRQKADTSRNAALLKSFFICTFVLMFGAFLAAPYFSVYVLKELHFGYYKYMAVMSIGQLVTYMIMKRWGMAADVFGSVRVMRVAFLGAPVIPLLWALNQNFMYLMVIEIFSGMVWAGYIIGVNNFLYEYAEPSLRTRYNSAFNFVFGIAQFLGAISGGYLYEKLPVLGGSAFITLLLISALFRAFAVIPFFRSIKEKSAYAKTGETDFFISLAGFRNAKTEHFVK
ncbi:MAG: MFS transporter [Elusimicrobia bacterium]|nr:MFS transporter [Elusimicrobiota bacterium]